MKEKNKKFLVIITILTIIFTISGGTLAYWNWYSANEERTNVVFTVGRNFSCAADGGGDITSTQVNLAPTTCTDTTRAIKRTVTVTPTITKEGLTINMDLWLNVNTLSSGLSQSLNFKYALTTESNSCTDGVISTGNFNNLTTGDKVKLLDHSYSSSTPQTYYLWIWLDKVETSRATQNQKFILSLGGECDDIEYNDLMFNTTTTTINNNTTFGVGSGFYTLDAKNSTCENGSTPTYNTNKKTITLNGVDKCNLKFTSVEKTLYDVVAIGDYVEYFGNNGCNGKQCNGWNAKQTDTDLYEHYGYCIATIPKTVTTYGWRVLYKEDNSVYIISAGTPECITSTANNNTQTISDFNTAALKYCNSSYSSNGICSYDTSHPFNDSDFYKFTSGYYGTNNGRHLSSGYGSNHCYLKYGNQYCGYNNDIIDNGGYYLFGSKYIPTDTTRTLRWNPENRNVSRTSFAIAYGLRPVLKLDSSILATGGKGTMDNPYTISERAGL